MYILASMDNERLRKLQDFEKKAGLRVIALSEIEVHPAQLQNNQMHEIEEFEKELGCCLVAVQ